MKIAIVSDSHGSVDRMKDLLTILEQEGISYLIHAGDFAVYGIEEVLAQHPNIQTYIAFGNADINADIIESVALLSHCHLDVVISLALEGKTIAVSHIAGVAESEYKKANVYVHGHTHRMSIEEKNEKLIINPGALSEDGTYLVISLPDMSIEKRIIPIKS